MGLFGNKKEDENEDEPEEEVPEIYWMQHDCDNCNHVAEDIEIPYGTLFKDHIRNIKCDECGCNILLPEENIVSSYEEE